MSTKTERPVNRFPNARAHTEDEVVALASAPLPDADRTYAGLPTNGLSKNKEDLAIKQPRLRETPRGSLHSRNFDTRFTGTLLRIKSIWRRLALSLLLLLPTTLLLTMVDDELSSVASVLSTNNFNMVIGLIVGALCIFVAWFAKGNVYTRVKGLHHAVNGYHDLDSRWESIYEKNKKAGTNERMVQAKREIDSAITKLDNKIDDVDKANRWNKPASLYSGTSVVLAYEEHKERLDLILDVCLRAALGWVSILTNIQAFERTAKRRGTHFPLPPGPIEV
ncbi:hypothetical protein B0H11DRAFT_1929715 [Mycena galericulata]|nr:hypothetical protein B0H11DRAFT_1929715 [Mycena galericulata]